jgi:hypothetical protein
MFGLRQAINSKSLAAFLSCILSAPALAAPASAPGMDSFAHTAKPIISRAPGVPASGHLFDAPGDMGGNGKPVTQWFETYDVLKYNAKPSTSEQSILTKPFNQELERVQAFIATVSDISKRYRKLAADLRKMPVQENWTGVKQFRNDAADFYDDAANVYDEMIKPRPPSKTKEELIAKLNEIKEHADIVGREGKTLLASDEELRRNLGVHQDRETDALWHYASSKRAGDTSVHK